MQLVYRAADPYYGDDTDVQSTVCVSVNMDNTLIFITIQTGKGNSVPNYRKHCSLSTFHSNLI